MSYSTSWKKVFIAAALLLIGYFLGHILDWPHFDLTEPQEQATSNDSAPGIDPKLMELQEQIANELKIQDEQLYSQPPFSGPSKLINKYIEVIDSVFANTKVDQSNIRWAYQRDLCIDFLYNEALLNSNKQQQQKLKEKGYLLTREQTESLTDSIPKLKLWIRILDN